MARFEDFIQKDTEQLAREAEKAAQAARQTIAAGAISTRAVKASLDDLGLQNEALQQQTRRFIAAARLRRHVLLKALGENGEVQLPPVALSPLPDLSQLQTTIRNYAAELRKSADADERKKLEADFTELSDRALLAGMLPVVTDEIQRLKTIRFLTECAGDTATNTITKMGNDIADTVITPRLRDRFQEEIVRLAASKVRVEIVRSGGKYGSPQYQVRLFAKPDAKIHEILSEGEKTCVALAAFMTELATAMHRSALVFDDPVSSLDHRWRGQVAKRLVEEAENRQVIVFTHDLVFVNDLNDHATKTGRAVRLTTLVVAPREPVWWPTACPGRPRASKIASTSWRRRHVRQSCCMTTTRKTSTRSRWQSYNAARHMGARPGGHRFRPRYSTPQGLHQRQGPEEGQCAHRG